MKKLFSLLALMVGLTTASFAGTATSSVSTKPATEQSTASRVLYASSMEEAQAIAKQQKAAAAASDLCIDIYDFPDVVIIIIYDC